jgi:hypothetical protein
MAQQREYADGALPDVEGMNVGIGYKRQHYRQRAHAAHFRLHVFDVRDAAQKIEAAHTHGLVQFVHDEAQDTAGTLLKERKKSYRKGLVLHGDDCTWRKKSSGWKGTRTARADRAMTWRSRI